MKRVLFTIIYSNYMAHAAALHASAKKHLKDTSVLVYVLDCGRNEKARLTDFAKEHGIELDPGFIDSLRFADDIKRIDCSKRRKIYGVTELCTSAKASIFLELIAEFGRNTHFSYVDPDIEFYSDCSSFFEEAEKHSFYLMPHFLEPPEDSYFPNPQTILAAGTHNFGYLGITPSYSKVTEALLWWERRLERECVVDLQGQIFVDQKWGSFFANQPGAGICLSPEYNVAYWNLHDRHIFKAGNTTMVSGMPLGFFHFSGYDPQNPLALSKHQTRFSLKALPNAYQQLFLSYAKKLMSFGYAQWHSFKAQKESPAPQTLPSRQVFLPALYRSPEDIAHMIPLKAAFWTTALVARKHFQLAKVFIKTLVIKGPLQAAKDTIWQYGRCAKKALKMLTLRNRPIQTSPNKSKFAVIGYFSDESGTGEGGRCIANAVFEISDDCCLYDISNTSSSRKLHDFKHKDRAVVLRNNDHVDTLIVAVNADRVNGIINSGYDNLFQKARKKIGYWWWETEDFPRRWIHASYYFDEIWVATEFIKRTLEKALPVPVKLMPPLLDLDIHPGRNKTSLVPNIDKQPYFLMLFDGYSNIHRKNPSGAIIAFKRAKELLGASFNARLVIKAINLSDKDKMIVEGQTRGLCCTVISKYLSKEVLLDLLGGCSGFISLHRSEGLGLNIIDAMLLERPVIATKYSGNLDFMNENNSCLIDGKIVGTSMIHGVYQGSTWMEPDTEQAAEAIVEILSNPEKAAKKGRLARQDIIKKYNPDITEKIFARELIRQ